MSHSEAGPGVGQREGPPTWIWIVGGGCGLLSLLVALLVLFFFVAGEYGPETDVYAGNEVPGRFLDAMREVGALEPEERIDYFYSDGFLDIRSGFCFVSDRRVVAYRKDRGDQALTSVRFDEIADAELQRDESFFVDSQLTLDLKEGGVVSFPVSSEHEGDVRFYQAVRARAGIDGEPESP